MTTKQALVLGGGGIAGIAWETGVLRGIADESPAAARALLDSDVLVGTSAGSAVAHRSAVVPACEDLFARQDRRKAPRKSILAIGIDAVVGAFPGRPSRTRTATVAQKRQRIGAVALATETLAEPVRRYVIAQRLPAHAWPDRVLRVTAIDIAHRENSLYSTGIPASTWSTRWPLVARYREHGRR